MNRPPPWLVRAGAAMASAGHWLATLGFWQFVGFSLLLLVAGGVVDDVLFSGGSDRVVVETKARPGPPDAAPAPAPAAASTAMASRDARSRAQEVHIGWNGITVTDRDHAVPGGDGPETAEVVDAVRVGGKSSRGVMPLLLAALALMWVMRFVLRSRAQADARADRAEAAAEREALERKLAEARLQSLQAQIEPHFFFNTLAAVEHLIETDPPRAGQMQRHLIEFLRGAMPQMGERTRPLGDEIDLCRSYLSIMKIRMEDRLSWHIDMPPDLAFVPFPTLMLQSVVENAIKHGLEPKAEGGSLMISVRAAAGRLRVIVADSGLGFGSSATAGTGVGLDNIRQRLQAMFGERAALVISANAPTGAQVTIEVPIEGTDGHHRG